MGRSLCALGRYDEAEPLASSAASSASHRTHDADALAAGAGARRRHRGHHTQAEQLAREAVALIEDTDALNWQGDALCDLAEVLHAAGRRRRSRSDLVQALERYDRRRNLAQAMQVRDRMAALQQAAPP